MWCWPRHTTSFKPLSRGKEFRRCWLGEPRKLEVVKRVIEFFIIPTITELHSQGKSRGITNFCLNLNLPLILCR